MDKLILRVLTLAFLLYSCNVDKIDDPLDEFLHTAISNSSPSGDIDHFILPTSGQFENIPQDELNPLTIQKVTLGKFLFYETGFSIAPAYEVGKETYSCATCHVPSSGFTPGRIQGIADGGVGFGNNGETRDQSPLYQEDEMDIQGIRPLSLLNVAYVKNTSWSGQFGGTGINEGTEDLFGIHDPGTLFNELGLDGLETQNIAGIDLHRMIYDKEIISELGYKHLFDQAFPDFSEEERYSKLAASFAISAYLRTLLSNQAPFQSYLKGNTQAMSRSEKEGALLFFGKAGCARCHHEPNLGSPKFYSLGVNDLVDVGAYNTSEEDKKNLGRAAYTGAEEDKYKFKIPQLYNLKDFAFYFHGSSKSSIEEVVDYFNDGIPENDRVPADQVSSLLQPLHLTAEEVDNLVSFLKTGLYDPNLERYVPESVLSGNCIPNNDDASRIDLGCN